MSNVLVHEVKKTNPEEFCLAFADAEKNGKATVRVDGKGYVILREEDADALRAMLADLNESLRVTDSELAEGKFSAFDREQFLHRHGD